MQIKISVIKNKFDNKPVNHICTYDELVTLLTTFIKEDKEKAPAFIAGHFINERRITDNLESRTLITLDVDNFNGTLDELIIILKELDNYRYIAYSTASHTIDKPRIRIVLFLNEEVATSNYTLLAKQFISTLSVELQDSLDLEASTTANKPFITPISPYEGYVYWYNVNAGLAVDLNSFNNVEIKENVTEHDPLLVTINNKPLEFGGDTKKIVIAWLKKYPANETDYNAWLQVGMALHHQFQGSNDGLDLWNKWSKKDDRVRENGEPYYVSRIERISYYYNNMKSDTIKPIKFSTIIALAKKKEENEKKDFDIKITKSKPLCRSKWVDYKGKNITPKFTANNFEILLKHYNIDLKYNVIKKDVEIYFNNVKSNDINQAINDIELLCTLNDLPYNLVSKTINNFAINNSYNSWKTWIDSKKWDGVDRLEDFYNTIRVIPEHEFVKKLYLWKFLLQLIHITCLNENLRPKMAKLVLTLQGVTDAGKTTWITKLVDDSMYDHIIAGQNLDLSKETDIKKIVEHVIVELGEIGSTYKRSDIDTIKNFISASEDLLNIKYLQRAQKTRRTTVFISTVNELSFLQDSTGNSRFMCLSVTKCDIFHELNMQQLYAQVLEYARNNINESYFLNEEEAKTQKQLNETMEVMSPFEEKLYDIFDFESDKRENIMNATNILTALGYNQQFIKKSHTNEISKILDKRQFVRHNKAPRGWFMPPKKIKDYGF